MYEVLSVLSSEDLKQNWWTRWMQEGQGKADLVVYQAVNRSLRYNFDRFYDLVKAQSDLRVIFDYVERLNKVIAMMLDLYNGRDEVMKEHAGGFLTYKNYGAVFMANFQRSKSIVEYKADGYYNFICKDLKNVYKVDDDIIEKYKTEIIDILNDLFEEARKFREVKDKEEEEKRRAKEERKVSWMKEKMKGKEEEKSRNEREVKEEEEEEEEEIIQKPHFGGGVESAFPYGDSTIDSRVPPVDLYVGKVYYFKFLKIINKIFYDIFEEEAKKRGIHSFDDGMMFWLPGQFEGFKLMDKARMFDKVKSIYSFYCKEGNEYYMASFNLKKVMGTVPEHFEYYLAPFNLEKGLEIVPKRFDYSVCIDKVEKMVNYPLFDVKT